MVCFMASISWRARSVKAALRAALKESGKSAREVARELDVPRMRVNRWLDDDEPPPNAEDTALFLARINTGGDERDRILTLARTPDVDWLVSGHPGINPQLATVLELERYATRITEWQPLIWPGLLQSSSYAREVISRSGEFAEQEIETRVMMRLARRDALTRRQPVEFTALVGLPAVLGTVGEPDVMADQLSHVRGVTGLPNVTIQVVDLSQEWTPGHAGAFILYEFSDMPATVYLEHHRSGATLVDEADVADYKAAAEIIRRAAMSPEETARLIADAIPRDSKETAD
jgi:hypothetical protein